MIPVINTIYYHPAWQKLQQEKENGTSEVFHYRGEAGTVCYPYIKRFAGRVDGLDYYDLVTARGEAGPLAVCENNVALQLAFNTSFQQYCDENRIIAEYIRFDPWNHNVDSFSRVYNIQYHGDAYTCPLTEDFFHTQYSSKRRNQIRKAESCGLRLDLDAPKSCLKNFLELYHYTDAKYSVSPYYQLSLPFLERYYTLLGDAVKLGLAYLGDLPIAAAIFLNGGDIFHYHFSASHPDYTTLNAISYLIREEALSAAEEGCVLMDLGSATPNSGLEKFKKSFVKQDGILPCYVGTKIRNAAVYERLVNENGSMPDGYFPAYRRMK